MSANYSDIEAVAVIDLAEDSASVEGEIARACADWGFFHLIGHGLEAALLAGMMREARTFFRAPAATKRALSRSRDNPWGYYDRELTKNQRDKKEIFDIGPDVTGLEVDGDVFLGRTPYPKEHPDFRGTAAAYFLACEDLCLRLLAPIAGGLGVAPEHLGKAFRGAHTSFLRLNHYPTGDLLAGEAEQPAGLGIHHHTDAGAITVLMADGRPGLEVMKNGVWRPVNSLPGGLIVNIGDMAQVWSNDAYTAPLHRVLAMETQERLSVAYFFNPAYSAVIEPLPTTGETPLYRAISWSEFRRRRADGDFADYGSEVQISDYRLS